MRRLLIFVLVALPLLAAGCGTAQPETSAPDTAPPEAQAAQPTATPAPAATDTPTPAPTAPPTPAPTPTPIPGRAMISAAEGGTVELAAGEDSGIVLEIPPGALADDTEISIRELDESEIPADLADAPLAGAVFRLEPDGQEFSEPVTVALTVRRADLAHEGFGMPLILLATRSTEGSLDLAANHALIEVGDGRSLTVRGEITHFSDAFAVEVPGVAGAALVPPDVTLPVGDWFRASAWVENRRQDSIEVDICGWEGVPPVGLRDPGPLCPDADPVALGPAVGGLLGDATFECERRGSGAYIAHLDITFFQQVGREGMALLDALLQPWVFEEEFEQEGEVRRVEKPVKVRGEAECTEPQADEGQAVLPGGALHVPYIEHEGYRIPVENLSYYQENWWPYYGREILDCEGVPVDPQKVKEAEQSGFGPVRVDGTCPIPRSGE